MGLNGGHRPVTEEDSQTVRRLAAQGLGRDAIAVATEARLRST
ncbi:hypothetical protein [Streptomyces sp. NPDC052012]